MSKVRDFLSKLDDYELAFFAKFKLHTYIKDTQLAINTYLIERNLNESEINRLVSKNPKSKLNDTKERCSRCYSDKIRKNKVAWTTTNGGIGIEDEMAILDGLAGRSTYKNEIICNVCGLWLSDPNNEKGGSFWKTIWDFIS